MVETFAQHVVPPKVHAAQAHHSSTKLYENEETGDDENHRHHYRQSTHSHLHSTEFEQIDVISNEDADHSVIQMHHNDATSADAAQQWHMKSDARSPITIKNASSCDMAIVPETSSKVSARVPQSDQPEFLRKLQAHDDAINMLKERQRQCDVQIRRQVFSQMT